MQRKAYTVSELNRLIKRSIEGQQEFANVLVQGEIANFKRHYQSGHCYFVLKDKQSVLKSVMFAGKAAMLRFTPRDGDLVTVVGRIGVYERDGVYQLYADLMIPAGEGALMQQLEALKKKLQAEGLFDAARKKPLPSHPKVIGVVTSGTGAAIHDIITVTARRDRSRRILLYPVRVQGAGAAQEIAHAIAYLNKHKLADVLIVGRGGGSLEDLWAFNEEPVVRAVAASEIPVVSAVGHEVDFTLTDFAADVRAATPSQAAELVVPDAEKDLRQLRQLAVRSARALEYLLERRKNRFDRLRQSRVFTQPYGFIEEGRLELDAYGNSMKNGMEGTLERLTHRLSLAGTKLEALNPLQVLSRGYSLTTDEAGRPLKNPDEVQQGMLIKTYLEQGEISSVVRTVRKETL